MNRTTKSILLAGSLLVALPLVRAQTEDLPYTSGSTGLDGPLTVPTTFPIRSQFACVYDPVNDEIVLHGGYNNQTGGYYSDTLVFNGTEWSKKTTATFVSARTNSEMVYDLVRDVVVMFGGYRADAVRLNDTWTWDGNNWTLLNPVNKPAARYAHEMVWDPVNERVILFGGLNSANQELADMWSWDGTNWSQIAATNTPEPSYYYNNNQQMVYDAENNRLVLYNSAFQMTYGFNIDTLTWTKLPTAIKPSVGAGFRMVYDDTRGHILLQGGQSNTQTWVFDNNEWAQLSPANPPTYSYGHGLVYNPADGKVYRFYGYSNISNYQDTHVWDGTNWSFVVGRYYTIDMAAKPDGLWNYTSIYVPSSVEVVFKPNIANTPVIWLAQEQVRIDGNVIVNGESAVTNDQSGRFAKGGPGGYAGGIGGVRFDVSGSYLGTSGQGPGGGIAPTAKNTHGRPGTYNGTYGNRLIQPLIGGSGGSGGSSNDTTSAGNGGGGGGALLIASSRDIVINGGVYANGGNAYENANQFSGYYGGGGSGGGIRLVADRVSGTGTIQANGGQSYGGTHGGAGRIRIEAFYRPITPNASPVPSASAPTETDAFINDRILWISNVAGVAVGNNPTGSLISPDVVFTNAGTVTISVQSQNVPVGTPVKLRISTSEGVINLPLQGSPSVTLDGSGSATFSTIVPAGLGTLQATAEFTIDSGN